MKKIFAILCAASALLISCTKVAPEAQEIETGNAAGKLQVNIAVSREGDTKAVKTGWEKGDVIYVFFNQLAASATPKYLTLTFDGNGWDNTWYGDADADLLTMSTGTMTAVYFPFHSGQVTIAKDGDNYTFKNGTENIYSYYMKCENAEYSVSAGVLTGTLAMAIPGASTGNVVQLYIPDENPVAGKYSLCLLSKLHNTTHNEYYQSRGAVCINGLGAIKEEKKYLDPSIAHFSGELDLHISALVKKEGAGKGYYFYAYTPWDSYETDKIRYFLYDEVNKTSYVLFTDQTSVSGAIQLPVLSTNWIEFVDFNSIGIASHNINASAPEEIGSYFAWGETSPKSYYSWDNYKFGTNLALSKYNSTDGKKTLEAEDDAATVLWGAPWRTPTREELSTIFNNGSGNITFSEESGCLKVTNSMGYSVLFPASNHIEGTESKPYDGTLQLPVNIMTSTLWDDYGVEYIIAASVDGATKKTNAGTGRCFGVPVRPVFDLHL